jgi:hypothetical protein
VVEHHRDRLNRLANRARCLARCDELADELSDVVRSNLIDAPLAEQR